MRVSEVTVTVHEKRSLPDYYGYYDCNVTMTAQVDQREREGADSAVQRLRDTARHHVREECDGWIRGLSRRRALSHLIDRFEHASSAEELELLVEEFDELADDPESDDTNPDLMSRADEVYHERKQALAARAEAELEHPTEIGGSDVATNGGE